MTPEARRTDQLRRARLETAKVIEERVRVPSGLSVSEWADRNRALPTTAAEPGRWRTDRTPYLREIMDSASDPLIERISFRKPSQIGGSEALLNIAAYYVVEDPSSILIVQPTIGEAEKFSKERVGPMFNDTETLRKSLADAQTSKDPDDTSTSKRFTGGHMGIVGANAPTGLRMRPRRVALLDEIDAYPASAGDEGDPISLVRKRQTTYWNRIEYAASTPTLKDLSRIEELEAEADEVREYRVACVHCAHMQPLTFANLKWDKEDATEDGGDKRHLPETVRYVCESCGEAMYERDKYDLLRDEKAGGVARWVARVPYAHGRARRIGFVLNAVYSPWLMWEDLVREWLDAQGRPEKLQVFVNTRLAETWDEAGHTVDETGLFERREKYDADPLPEGVVMLTAGVDVQADRLECEVVGWGLEDEHWSVNYFKIPGDPTGSGVWKDLDRILGRAYESSLGPRLYVAAAAVDAGYETQTVLKYAKDRVGLVYAVKGVDGFGRPIFGAGRRSTKGRVPLYPAGVDNAKALVYNWLRTEEPGPGYAHFPDRAPYDEEYFRQLTGEKVVRRMTRARRLVPHWVVRPNRRVEALDCRVYALVAKEALHMAGQRVEDLYRELVEDAEPDEVEPERRDDEGGSDWVDGWRR